MHLAWIELRDFRNHRATLIEDVPEGSITIMGPNGEGKTNLLEGMFFLYALRSPRTSTNAPLVREGAEVAYARGEFEGLDGRALVEAEIPRKGASRVKLHKSPLRRKRELRRVVRAVLFGPFDLPAVIGDPSKRRDLMDEAVLALWPLRDTVSSGYDRVLRQRNRLLKEWEGGRGGPPELEAWDEELIAAGTKLIEAREEAVARLAPAASEEFQALSGYELIVSYAPNVVGEGSVEERFRAQLAARRADELVRRTSLVGPHRDDLTLAVRDLGPSLRLARRDVGGGALPPAGDRRRGRRRDGGAAAPVDRRPVQRARPDAPRSDRRAPGGATGSGRDHRRGRCRRAVVLVRRLGRSRRRRDGEELTCRARRGSGRAPTARATSLSRSAR